MVEPITRNQQGVAMSSTTGGSYPPVLVRAEQAERLASIGHVLLADASATDGALSTHRVTLARGADGAVPHRHDASSELFFVLDGALDVLVGEQIVTAGSGDLLVVPPGTAHAFAAQHGSTADALIVITPGVERFDYFRHVVRIRDGSAPPASMAALQDVFDTHFLTSPQWQYARTSTAFPSTGAPPC